jgi:hypothetical protein
VTTEIRVWSVLCAPVPAPRGVADLRPPQSFRRRDPDAPPDECLGQVPSYPGHSTPISLKVQQDTDVVTLRFGEQPVASASTPVHAHVFPEQDYFLSFRKEQKT